MIYYLFAFMFAVAITEAAFLFRQASELREARRQSDTECEEVRRLRMVVKNLRRSARQYSQPS